MDGVEEYIKSLENYNNERKKLKKLYESKSIEDLRSNYAKYIKEVGYSLGRLNNTKEALEKLNELTQKGVTYEENSRKIDKEIIGILNSSRIGTLQGIARQTLREQKINPNPEDVMATEVLKQSYDESADIIRNQNINNNENIISNENKGGRKGKGKGKGKRITNRKKILKKGRKTIKYRN